MSGKNQGKVRDDKWQPCSLSLCAQNGKVYEFMAVPNTANTHSGPSLSLSN